MIVEAILGAALLTAIASKKGSKKTDMQEITYDSKTHKSFLNEKNLPRGVRNNNIGNITKTNINWMGKIKNGTDAHFEQFISIPFGIRALIKNIRTEISRGKTLKEFTYRYAPPSENNTAAYLNALENATGMKPDDKLKDDKALIKALVFAIGVKENGKNYTDNTDFEQGYELSKY